MVTLSPGVQSLSRGVAEARGACLSIHPPELVRFWLLCSVDEIQCHAGFVFWFVKMGPFNLHLCFREAMRGSSVLSQCLRVITYKGWGYAFQNLSPCTTLG